MCICVCVEGGGGGGGSGGEEDEDRSCWRSLRWQLRWRRRRRLQWMAPPRLSDEQKALSRQRRRDRRRELQRLRRADPEYRLAERTRNTRARREQRNDPEYRQKERERDTRAHRERRIRNVTSSLCRTNGNAPLLPPHCSWSHVGAIGQGRSSPPEKIRKTSTSQSKKKVFQLPSQMFYSSCANAWSKLSVVRDLRPSRELIHYVIHITNVLWYKYFL